MISKILGDKQKVWLDATQKRFAITVSTPSQTKTMKMMGLDGVMNGTSKDERIKETRLMEKYSWVIV